MMELFKKVFKDLFSGNVKKTENKDIEYETKIPKQQVTPPRISNKNTIKKNDERRKLQKCVFFSSFFAAYRRLFFCFQNKGI